MMFPRYVKKFSPKSKGLAAASFVVDNKRQVLLILEGMTCMGCEHHVNLELAKVAGVISYSTSYAEKNSVVTFD